MITIRIRLCKPRVRGEAGSTRERRIRRDGIKKGGGLPRRPEPTGSRLVGGRGHRVGQAERAGPAPLWRVVADRSYFAALACRGGRFFGVRSRYGVATTAPGSAYGGAISPAGPRLRMKA